MATLALVLPLPDATSPWQDAAHSILIAEAWGCGIGSAAVFRSGLAWAATVLDPRWDDAAALVLARWDQAVASGDMVAASREKYGRSWLSLVRHADARGATTPDEAAAWVEEWIWSPVKDAAGRVVEASEATVRFRRSVARSGYAELRALGLSQAHPAIDTPVERTSTSSPGILSEQQVNTCRVIADLGPSTRTAASVALALCGCSPQEIGATEIHSVLLDEAVVLANGTGTTRRRTLAIPGPWEARVLRERIDYLRGLSLGTGAEPSRLFLAGSRTGLQPASGSAISMTIGNVLRSGRLSGDARPTSLQAYAARRAFDASGDIIEAARVLGTNSLDTASRTIGLDWASLAIGRIAGVRDGAAT